MPGSRSDAGRFPRALARRMNHNGDRRRRILLVAAASFPLEQFDSTFRSYAELDAEVRIVAPASNISKLEWLTNDEDSARDEAADRAEVVAERVPADVTSIEVGDTDPFQAVEDALRVFRADEMVIFHGPEDSERWEELATAQGRERFGVPVTQVVAEARPEGSEEGRRV